MRLTGAYLSRNSSLAGLSGFYVVRLSSKEGNLANWLVIGPKDNWALGLRRKTWGFSDYYQPTWIRIDKGDILLFYVTSPISGIVGYGKVKQRFRDETPLWGAVFEGKKIWPLRVRFEITTCLPQNKWESDRVKSALGKISVQRSLQLLDKQKAQKFCKLIST